MPDIVKLDVRGAATVDYAPGWEKLMTAARRSVLRVEEYLPCPKERVWRPLTDPDLIARWLMPNDLRLQAGHRFATRHIGEAAATIDGWHAAIGRLAEALRLRL